MRVFIEGEDPKAIAEEVYDAKLLPIPQETVVNVAATVWYPDDGFRVAVKNRE